MRWLRTKKNRMYVYSDVVKHTQTDHGHFGLINALQGTSGIPTQCLKICTQNNALDQLFTIHVLDAQMNDSLRAYI